MRWRQIFQKELGVSLAIGLHGTRGKKTQGVITPLQTLTLYHV